MNIYSTIALVILGCWITWRLARRDCEKYLRRLDDLDSRRRAWVRRTTNSLRDGYFDPVAECLDTLLAAREAPCNH